MRISYSDPRAPVMDILKHGAEVEVVELLELRREVLGQLRNIVKKYEGQQ